MRGAAKAAPRISLSKNLPAEGFGGKKSVKGNRQGFLLRRPTFLCPCMRLSGMGAILDGVYSAGAVQTSAVMAEIS